MRIYRVILSIVFSVTVCTSFSQVTASEFIRTTEEEHDVSFSFLDDNIAGKSIPEPQVSLPINLLIRYMEKYLGLRIRKTAPGQYVISSVPSPGCICGILLDEETGQSVPGATIRGNKITSSNNDGFFILPVEPEQLVTINTVSYEPMLFLSNDLIDEPCLEIPMRLKTTILPAITIKNYLSKGISRAEDGSLLFRMEPLKALPGLVESDVLHSLQFLPGIQSVDETVSDVNIRGGTNDQNLVLYNGIRVYQTGHFFGLISAFNPYDINEAQLIKNGTSARYGDAVSGTINIKSGSRIPESSSLQMGSNMIYADAKLELPIGKKVGLYLSSRRSVGNYIQTPTYTSYFERAFRDTQVINSSPGAGSLANSDQGFRFYDINLNLVFEPNEKDRIQLYGFLIDNKVDFTENAVINNIVESRTSSLDQLSNAAGVKYLKWWNKKFNTESLISVSDYQLGAINNDLQLDQILDQKNSVLDYQFKSTSRYLLTRSDILFGYQFNNVGVDNITEINNPAFRQRIKDVLTTHAMFLELNRNFGKLSLRSGIRGNYFYELQRWRAEPRFYASYPVSNSWKIDLSGEWKSQSMVQRIDLQSDFLGVEKRKWELADDQLLNLVMSRQFTAGIEFKKDSLLIHAEAYYKKVDGISTLTQGFVNQFRTVSETGAYSAKGLDLLGNYGSEKYSIWMSYSYSINTFTFPLLDPTEFPTNLDTPHSFSFGANFRYNNWLISSGMNWRSGRPYTGLTGPDQLDFAEPNQLRVQDYFRLDISSSYTFEIFGKQAILAASIWNLTNRNNIFNAYYSQLGNTIIFNERTALPLTANLSLRLKLI